jgi:hypothetical protein
LLVENVARGGEQGGARQALIYAAVTRRNSTRELDASFKSLLG